MITKRKMIEKLQKENVYLTTELKGLVERVESLEKKLAFISEEKVDIENKKKKKWLNGDPTDSEISKRGIIR